MSRGSVGKIWIWTAVLVIVLTSFLFGFYTAHLEGEGGRSEGGVMIIDDFGRTVIVPPKLQRIVSLSPSCTEILFAAGLGDEVVGVDQYSDYPKEVKALPKVGTYVEPDLEKILTLQPDLVVASDMISREMIENFEEKGLILVVLAPKDLDGVLRDIRLMGAISGLSTEVDRVAKSLEDRIEAVTTKIEKVSYRPRVYLEYYPYWTFGPGSYGHDLILMAGGDNIASSSVTAYPEVTNEFIVSSNPEIIIYTVGVHASTTAEDIKGRPGWREIDAVRKDRIYTLDDDIISRPGPRLVDALEELAKIIHPELFP